MKQQQEQPVVRDRDYWARLHIRSDRSPAIDLSDRRRRRTMGTGCRFQRGGEGADER